MPASRQFKSREVSFPPGRGSGQRGVIRVPLTQTGLCSHTSRRNRYADFRCASTVWIDVSMERENVVSVEKMK